MIYFFMGCAVLLFGLAIALASVWMLDTSFRKWVAWEFHCLRCSGCERRGP
jgi:hypothetical protein